MVAGYKYGQRFAEGFAIVANRRFLRIGERVAKTDLVWLSAVPAKHLRTDKTRTATA
jgi:hypothetical protein